MPLDLSRLIGRPVRDARGDHVATLRDVIVRLGVGGGAGPYPPVTGLMARVNRRDFFIPADLIVGLDEGRGATLSAARFDLRPFARREGEILLEDDLLDKQVIDLGGVRVVRASDLLLDHHAGRYVLMGLEIGSAAIVRRIVRLGPARRWRGRVLDWAEVDPFASEAQGATLTLAHEKLARLHPAEIARIADAVSYRQGAELMGALDDEVAADTLEEMDEERQAGILDEMDEGRAADILEEMEPDAAADLLAELTEEKQDSLLAQMEREDAADVQRLLGYDEDTAGGLMTNYFLSVPAELTTSQAVTVLRPQLEELEAIYNVYVVEPAPQRPDDPPLLVGRVSLRDLLLGGPDQPLAEYMDAAVRTVRPTALARDVAHMMAEFNLLSLPVTDAGGYLLGVVTVDDAMDVLLPEAAGRRAPGLLG